MALINASGTTDSGAATCGAPELNQGGQQGTEQRMRKRPEQRIRKMVKRIVKKEVKKTLRQDTGSGMGIKMRQPRHPGKMRHPQGSFQSDGTLSGGLDM